MKKLIIIVVLITGCSSNDGMKKAVKEYFSLCNSKVSSTLYIGGWNQYIEFKCEDMKHADSKGAE